ncbi:hypothetical protein [Escherichia albertii]|uniref:hypothetical protein n=1 Tax=Escherichia albertii TaxID=208962 RepID=UPI00211A185B|nr:hypothetical protein [Escherichia albertii]UUL21364.1 hypothetical protein NIZ13_23755 [Escherichia albertii]
MKLTTLLKKHFDIEEITDVDSTVNREVYTIWVYEKGEDCEPLLILKDAQDFMGVDGCREYLFHVATWLIATA